MEKGKLANLVQFILSVNEYSVYFHHLNVSGISIQTMYMAFTDTCKYMYITITDIHLRICSKCKWCKK